MQPNRQAIVIWLEPPKPELSPHVPTGSPSTTSHQASKYMKRSFDEALLKFQPFLS
jgi:hypothetical protein